MENPALLVIIGIIGLAIGFALGIGLMSLRTPRADKEGDAPTPVIESIPQTAPPPVQPAPKKESELVPPTLMSETLVTPIPQKKPAPINPVDMIARALQSEVRAPKPQPKSIAAQIDEILQEMLEESPLSTKAIRLLELPAKGMVVMVGLDHYEGVDAVPDEDIRNVIRAAVAEWERRVSELP